MHFFLSPVQIAALKKKLADAEVALKAAQTEIAALTKVPFYSVLSVSRGFVIPLVTSLHTSRPRPPPHCYCAV